MKKNNSIVQQQLNICKFIVLLACLLIFYFSALSHTKLELTIIDEKLIPQIAKFDKTTPSKEIKHRQWKRYHPAIPRSNMPIQTEEFTIPNQKLLPVIRNTFMDDFLVNDDTIGGAIDQFSPSIAVNGNGNFVIAWFDFRNGNYDIYFQRYNSSGFALSANVKVNDDVGIASQGPPSIAIDRNGNFIITWYDYRNNNWDIYFQRYNSDGIALGTNVKVNNDIGMAGQWYPSIAVDEQGNFIITWMDNRNGNHDIYYQRYNSQGVAQGTNIKVNDDVGTAIQRYPVIAVNRNGNFVIAWDDERNSNLDIYYQRYSPSGTAQGVNVKVNDDGGTTAQGRPSITMDGAGNFIIAWEDRRNGNSDVYYQRYNSSGIAQGVNIMVNDDIGITSQGPPSINIDGNGTFIITFADRRNSNLDIYYQRYNSDGKALGVNEKVNDDITILRQWDPSIAADGKGNFIITWEDERNGNWDIYFQLYNSTGIAQGVNTKANDDEGTADQHSPSIRVCDSGNFILVWEDYRNGNPDIYCQRYNSSGTAQGVNFKVNDDAGTAWQGMPSIAADRNGNFVIAWTDYRNGPSNPDIYFQLFDSTGMAQGVNEKVNDDIRATLQWSPSVTMDANGNFVIAWMDYRSGNYDIYYQRYSSTGTTLGVNVKANDNTNRTEQRFPSITVNGNGNFIIVWEDFRNGNPDIYYQQYDSSGTALGINVKVNDDVGTAWQGFPSIGIDRNGNFVIAWEDERLLNCDIYFQRYNSAGTPLGRNLKANDDIGRANQIFPSIAVDENGNFVIVWEDYRHGWSNPEVMGQRYHSNGTIWGTNYQIVADGCNFGEVLPVVSANINKIFFAWMDNRRSKGWDIYAKQVFWDWEGITPVLSEKNIPTDFKLLQNYPNPFNPSTTIGFNLPVQSVVSLKVCNVLGQEVISVLDNETYDAGAHQVEISPRNLASGVYFYNIVTVSKGRTYINMKKMLYMK